MRRFIPLIALLLVSWAGVMAQTPTPTLMARNAIARTDTPPAPERLISLTANNRPMDQILKDLERQSGFTFLYSSDRFRAVRRSVSVTNQPLNRVLIDLVNPLGMTFEVVGRQIILRETSPNASAVVVERTVSGRVTATDSPDGMPGVNVSIKSTNRGTVTDRAGRYNLSIPEGDRVTLVFSFVGYERQEVAVGSQSTIDVVLKPDERSLSEVQVVAFGEQRTRDLTGSISSLKASDIRLNTAAPRRSFAGPGRRGADHPGRGYSRRGRADQRAWCGFDQLQFAALDRDRRGAGAVVGVWHGGRGHEPAGRNQPERHCQYGNSERCVGLGVVWLAGG
jgi:TonB-dependent starch-binding outer membrane protein SusC